MKDTISIIHNSSKEPQTGNPNTVVKVHQTTTKYPTSIKQLWISLNHALQWPQLKKRLQGPSLIAIAKKNWFGLSACALFLLFFFRAPDVQTTISGKTAQNQEASILPLEKASFSETATDNKVAPPPIPATAKKNPAKATEEEMMVSIPQIAHATRPDRSILKELGNHAQSLRDEYISRFVSIAKTEQERFGIPASVTLGLAILNSEFGTSIVAGEGNNHLHITCDENPVPMGKGMSGQGIHGGVCFTRYESAWMGFRAHSELIQRKYQKATNAIGTDYRKWAKVLDKGGYFNEDAFGSSALIKTIELYQLEQFDVAVQAVQ